jgi:hypothetical protein
VSALRAKYNVDPAKYKQYDVKLWSQESFEAGSKNAYDGKFY